MTTLPGSAGIGLRAVHHHELLARTPAVGWLEVHSENFFGAGGEPLQVLARARERYPVSLHGVGLSLGSSDELSQRHLAQLKALADRLQPAAISEHLCWSSINGRYLNDLLPLPYTHEALDLVCARIDAAQHYLGRRLLIENLSSYLQFRGADMPVWDFLASVARRTGCGILLDVNNIYVSSRNHGFNPLDYVNGIPAERVAQIHIAGHSKFEKYILDTHDHPVIDPVWKLYERATQRAGQTATLLEWDDRIPSFDEVHSEALKANKFLSNLEKKAVQA